jgi:hypothetical protein
MNSPRGFIAVDQALVRGFSRPLVSGAAAMHLGVARTAMPDAVAAWLLGERVVGRLTRLLPNTPNRRLSVQRLPGVGAPTPTPTPSPTTASFTLTSSCAARVCTIDASIPTNTPTATVSTVVYTWTIGAVSSTSGTNLRRMVLTFGSPGVLTVTAPLGSTTLGTASTIPMVRKSGRRRRARAALAPCVPNTSADLPP